MREDAGNTGVVQPSHVRNTTGDAGAVIDIGSASFTGSQDVCDKNWSKHRLFDMNN